MTDGSGFPPPPPPPSRWEEPPPPPYDPESEKQLKPVGIALVIYNALSVAQGLIFGVLLSALQSLMTEAAKQDSKLQWVADFYNQPWIGGMVWTGFFISILALVGSIFLMRRRNFGLAMAGAIVTMINPGGACSCIIGTGLGIWALVVLMKPEAQAAFNRP